MYWLWFKERHRERSFFIVGSGKYLPRQNENEGAAAEKSEIQNAALAYQHLKEKVKERLTKSERLLHPARKSTDIQRSHGKRQMAARYRHPQFVPSLEIIPLEEEEEEQVLVIGFVFC